MGVPCVATRVGGNPEIIRDGKDGLLVLPGDPREMARAISRFLREPASALRLGDSARKRIEDRFSITRMVGELEALYEDILPCGRRRAREKPIGTADFFCATR